MAHSLYTTNDRGVNEVAPGEILHSILVRGYACQFAEPPQLPRGRQRNAINRILNDRDVDPKTSMTYALKCAARLTGGGRKKIYREGLSLCHAQFNDCGPRGGLWKKTILKWFYCIAQSRKPLARFERVWVGGLNGIFKEVAQSLRFKIKGSARNVVKAR